MKGAACRGIDGGGELAAQHDPFFFVKGVCHRGGGEQGSGIGMTGMGKQFIPAGVFHRRAQVHDHHLVGDMVDNREIVADKEVGQVIFILQVGQQVEDLGLDGDVQMPRPAHPVPEFRAGA